MGSGETGPRTKEGARLTPLEPPTLPLEPKVTELKAPPRQTYADGEIVYEFGFWRKRQQEKGRVRARQHQARLLEQGLAPESLAALKTAMESSESRGPTPAEIPLPETISAAAGPARVRRGRFGPRTELIAPMFAAEEVFQPMATLQTALDSLVEELTLPKKKPTEVPDAPMAELTRPKEEAATPWDPRNEVVHTPPSSPEAKPASSEMPGSQVPRTPPYRAPAASSASAGPSGFAPTPAPDLWASYSGTTSLRWVDETQPETRLVPPSSAAPDLWVDWGWTPSLRRSNEDQSETEPVPPSSTRRRSFLQPEADIVDPELWRSIDGEPNPDFPVDSRQGKGRSKGKGKGKGKNKGKTAAGEGRTRTPRRSSWEAPSAWSSWNETGPSWRESEWHD
jgi:hypothetical protein